MSDDALLPCPLCGGEAREELFHSPAGVFDVVKCVRCDATCGPYPPPDEAIAAWNRRAGQSAAAERVAVLEAENERLREQLLELAEAIDLARICDQTKYWKRVTELTDAALEGRQQ